MKTFWEEIEDYRKRFGISEDDLFEKANLGRGWRPTKKNPPWHIRRACEQAIDAGNLVNMCADFVATIKHYGLSLTDIASSTGVRHHRLERLMDKDIPRLELEEMLAVWRYITGPKLDVQNTFAKHLLCSGKSRYLLAKEIGMQQGQLSAILTSESYTPRPATLERILAVIPEEDRVYSPALELVRGIYPGEFVPIESSIRTLLIEHVGRTGEDVRAFGARIGINYGEIWGIYEGRIPTTRDHEERIVGGII